MSIDGRAGNGLHPFDLPGSRHKERLQEVVEHGDRDDDHNKEWHGKDDCHEGADHSQRLIEDHAHRHWYGVVHNVNVLGKAVENPPQRCRIVEGHRRLDDAHEHGPVQLDRRVERKDGDHRGGHHDRDGLEEAQCSVHAQVHVPHALIRDGSWVVRPGRQPDVGADREALVDHVEAERHRGGGKADRPGVVAVNGPLDAAHLGPLRLDNVLA